MVGWLICPYTGATNGISDIALDRTELMNNPTHSGPQRFSRPIVIWNYNLFSLAIWTWLSTLISGQYFIKIGTFCLLPFDIDWSDSQDSGTMIDFAHFYVLNVPIVFVQ